MGILCLQFQVLSSIIDGIYHKPILINSDNFSDVLAAADYLGMDNLMSEFVEYFRRSLSLKNCLDFYNAARMYNLDLYENWDYSRNGDIFCPGDDFYISISRHIEDFIGQNLSELLSSGCNVAYLPLYAYIDYLETLESRYIQATQERTRYIL